MRFLRICRGPQRTNNSDVNWRAINPFYHVVVTESEGREDLENGQVLPASSGPQRFIGDARFTVCNIAPPAHKPSFHVFIDFDRPLVPWTDIIVFDGVKNMTRVSAPGSLDIDIPDLYRN